MSFSIKDIHILPFIEVHGASAGTGSEKIDTVARITLGNTVEAPPKPSLPTNAWLKQRPPTNTS